MTLPTHSMTGNPSDRPLEIDYVAKHYHVSRRMLQYYENVDLIHPKREGTTRIYSRRDCRRLEIILQIKEFGFSIPEIRNILYAFDLLPADTSVKSALSSEGILSQIDALEQQLDRLDETMIDL